MVRPRLPLPRLPLPRAPRPRRLVVDGLTALLAAGGLTLLVIGASPAPPPPERPAALAPSYAPPGSPVPIASSAAPGPKVTRGLGASTPVRLAIPAIGVDTPLMSLGLNPDGTVEVPPVAADAPAGWYRNLRTPGEVGPAVVLGHVDTAHEGPAVFYRLRELRPGDPISVRRADGSVAVFVAERVVEVPKSDFPTEDVYGPVDYPALRLVTCGGTFDHLRHTYKGNTLVYARLQPPAG
ncbi:class F sortase [Dactylosporangium matsuzakiense]|uniref:class F sortase n=1 Tax=Dactylosporangium matsuzakiense TaxID=53360 RepID=UPI0021C422FF|nr:class F sortase [Dactylosporangium matsuzakiense]UWZ42734.1 class F sortase [Dactylosporangium matsuzakiense]